jgi:hypothetical protein
MINGNCTGDENPDAWYPEQPNGGNPRTVIRQIVPEVKRAIALCNSCPSRQECLEEGLKPFNLAFGIWGGLLPGQRISIVEARGDDVTPIRGAKKLIAGPRGSGYTDDTQRLRKDERRNALSFFSRIKPYLEE